MQSKSLQLANQKISYYESTGSGTPILLVHGNSSSGLTFQYQINSPLGEKHRVIAIDLPGHGRSDPVDISAYSIPGYAAIITAAAQALNIEDAIIIGWSLGGHAVLEAHQQLTKAKGLAIYGTPPLAFPPAMEEAYLPNPAMGAAFAPDITEEAAVAFANACFSPDSASPHDPFVTDIMRTDGTARAGLAASITPDGFTDEVAIVANMSQPLAILHGENEQLVNAAYIQGLTMPTLWRNSIQMIPQSGHACHWESPETFNDLLAAFSADVNS